MYHFTYNFVYVTKDFLTFVLQSFVSKKVKKSPCILDRRQTEKNTRCYIF